MDSCSNGFTTGGSVFISEFMKELNRLLGIKTSASTRLPPTVRWSDRAGSTRNLRRTSGCSATTTRTTGTNSSCQQNLHAQTMSMLQPKSLPSSRIRAGTLGWASNRMWMSRMRMRRPSGIGCRKGWRKQRPALVKAQDEYTRYYNQQRDPAPVFEPRDMVLLDVSDIRTNRGEQEA